MDTSSRLERSFRIIFAVTPFILLACGILYEIIAILALNHGRFIYSLDDPYIHLALAERIFHGHYGINPTEFSAPSSSILWPFLLAPFAWTPFFEYIPLALNILAAAGSLWIYQQVAYIALCEGQASQGAVQPAAERGLPEMLALAGAAWIAACLILATNLVGLAFTGMEHSLQAFLCAAIILGLVLVIRGQPAPGWLVAALIAAPLTRYECLALTVPALVVLACCKRWKAAGVSLAGALLPIAAYSWFLHAHGLGWLPTSVIAKVAYAGQLYTHGFNVVEHFAFNMISYQGKVLGWIFLAMVWLAVSRRKVHWIERLLAAGGAAAILAHLAFGQIGWWERYEIYMMTAAFLLTIYLCRGLLKALFRFGWAHPQGWVRAAWPLVCIGVLCWLSYLAGKPYFKTFAATPLASANIYEQQYQMHRFVVDYVDEPVAVNDLGWVAYRNPNFVLDLWGLSSPEALANRTSTWNPDWMDRLAQQHGVRLVMIYDTWFPRHPAAWTPLARLHLGWKWTVAGSDTVTFYATTPASAQPLSARLQSFAPTLPPGVRMDLLR